MSVEELKKLQHKLQYPLKTRIAMRVYRFLKKNVIDKRPPNFVIGDKADPYLLRWYLIPRNPVVNIYLHVFMRSDTDEALHDHPWMNASYVLDGFYSEMMPAFPELWPGNRTLVVKRRFIGQWVFRKATAAHAVLLPHFSGQAKPQPCTSLFFTGPKVRVWGFYCPKGWKTFTDFIQLTKEGNTRGKGCE